MATVNSPTAYTMVLAISNWAVTKGEPLIYYICEVGELAFYQKFKLMCFSDHVFKSVDLKMGTWQRKIKPK
jgi:hypothetical protein